MDHLVNIRFVNKSQKHQFIKKIPFQTTGRKKKRWGKNLTKLVFWYFIKTGALNNFNLISMVLLVLFWWPHGFTSWMFSPLSCTQEHHEITRCIITGEAPLSALSLSPHRGWLRSRGSYSQGSQRHLGGKQQTSGWSAKQAEISVTDCGTATRTAFHVQPSSAPRCCAPLTAMEKFNLGSVKLKQELERNWLIIPQVSL